MQEIHVATNTPKVKNTTNEMATVIPITMIFWRENIDLKFTGEKENISNMVLAMLLESYNIKKLNALMLLLITVRSLSHVLMSCREAITCISKTLIMSDIKGGGGGGGGGGYAYYFFTHFAQLKILLVSVDVFIPAQGLELIYVELDTIIQEKCVYKYFSLVP